MWSQLGLTQPTERCDRSSPTAARPLLWALFNQLHYSSSEKVKNQPFTQMTWQRHICSLCIFGRGIPRLRLSHLSPLPWLPRSNWPSFLKSDTGLYSVVIPFLSFSLLLRPVFPFFHFLSFPFLSFPSLLLVHLFCMYKCSFLSFPSTIFFAFFGEFGVTFSHTLTHISARCLLALMIWMIWLSLL